MTASGTPQESASPAPVNDPVPATWAHVLPFAAWLILFQFLDWAFLPRAWQYAIRTAACLGLLLYYRPWRWYDRPQWENLPLAFGMGVLVLVIWVALETPWVGDALPGLQEFYLKFGVGIWPFGQVPEPLKSTPYAPEVCGWPLSLIRLAGSAFVIAVIEEFFWRGFLYRWMLGRNFLKVNLGAFDPVAFLTVSIVFGLEHQRWLAGILAGLAYAYVMIKTRDIWAACFAHVVTNFLLGVYVLAMSAYAFW